MGVASCSNPQGFFHAYRVTGGLTLFGAPGGLPVETRVGGGRGPLSEEQLGRGGEPGRDSGLEGYRMRPGPATDPGLPPPTPGHPWITVWDGHEMMNTPGAPGREPRRGRGDFLKRFKPPGRAHHEWMPIRTGPG
ncbi:MAG: hypothetical protein CM15mP74_05140 [Halieaceae bacterium]|nr:MAG: hypothetical protein CM15mP74_05140 [Halieaceae bacterium]